MMNSEQAQKNNTTPRSPASSSKRERKPSKNFDSMIFPQRLMAILADEENHEALSWLPDGRSFAIRDRDLFVETAMPQFCPKKSKFSSFVRKLSRWGFTRIHKGDLAGAYHHEFFLRDKPQLAAQMFYQSQRTMNAMAPTNAGKSTSNSLASVNMGSSTMPPLSSRPPLSSMPSRSKTAIKASPMSTVVNKHSSSSLPFNGNASAWDTQQAMKRADVGSSNRGTRTLDAFEIQKALLAACGVDPSGMTRPPPMDQVAASINQGSMMRMGQHQMRMGQHPQHGRMMMDQQAMESQRIRSLLDFEARKRLQKMMSSPNLFGANNSSNLMAVMMQQQQQHQQMSPKEAQNLKGVFQGLHFGRVSAAANRQPVRNNLSNSAA